MIISVHLPKTAGSSFRDALDTHFGDGLLLDYADRPLELSRNARLQYAREQSKKLNVSSVEKCGCVHGHFLAAKYSPLAKLIPLQYVTWLRHPVERIASHYYYWRQDPGASEITLLRRRMLDENWSLRQFALCDQMQNIYASFLAGLELEQFLFIGVTEYYEDDLAEFANKVLRTQLIAHHSNAANRSFEPLDLELHDEIMEFHAADMALYQQALAIRQRRRARDFNA